MLGHLVSTSRQSPPDFGVASWLRKTISGFQTVLHRALAPVPVHAHQRKKPHSQ